MESKIWQIPIEEFREIVNAADSIRGILRCLKLKYKGATCRTLYKRLDAEGIDRSRFKYNYGRGQIKSIIPMDRILVENSNYSRTSLKKRLLENGLIENKCAICGLLPVWNSELLVLTLDHINGINDDNRIQNLRLLCPNCHSQTSTFAGRRLRHNNVCKGCGKWLQKHYAFCKECKNKAGKKKLFSSRKTKIDWPDKETLGKMLWEMPTSKIAKELGVTDKAVSKRAKKYGLTKPARGYWAKRYSERTN